MNKVKIFNSEEFGDVRTVTINGEPWFVGKDVADILGYQNGSRDINRHVHEEDRQNYQNGTFDSPRGMTIINESGLYALIFGSKLESAVRFKHWVTSEVLPAIRRTGGYQMPAPQGKELLALAVLEAQKTIEAQNTEIERMKPKAIFADAVSASTSSILIGDLAKLLRQNGVDTGQKRLFEQLRNEGYLMKTGSSRNMPTQRYVADGLFQIKETVISNPDGSVRMTKTTKVTGKGQQYFLNKYLKNKEAV
nr:MAG TPA: repressor domain protein [Caudoviricetes sp.]